MPLERSASMLTRGFNHSTAILLDECFFPSFSRTHSLAFFLFVSNSRKVIIPIFYYFFKPHSSYRDNRKPHSLVHILCSSLFPNPSQLFEPEREYRRENKPLEYSLINYLLLNTSFTQKEKQTNFLLF